MKGILHTRYIVVVLLLQFLFSSFQGRAQYAYITHTTGIQTVGGVGVWVVPLNNPRVGGTWCSYYFPYWIGYGYNSAYLYSFATPITHAKLSFGGMNFGEIISLYINGAHYNISPSQLSTFLPTLCSPTVPAVVGGNLEVNISTGGNSGAVEISGILIDSIRVQHYGGTSTGTSFDFAILDDTNLFIKPPFTDTILCVGDSFNVRYGLSFKFKTGNSFTLQLSDSTGNFAKPTNIGFVNSKDTGTIRGIIPLNTPTGQGYRIRIVSTSPIDTSKDNGKNIRIRRTPQSITASSNSPVCAGDTIFLNSYSTVPGVSYKWTGPNSFVSYNANDKILNANTNVIGDYIVTGRIDGCYLKDTIGITVFPNPLSVIASVNKPICERDTLFFTSLSNLGGVAYNWSGPNNFMSNAKDTILANTTMAADGDYIITTSLPNGCFTKAIATTQIKPLPVAFSASSNIPVCLHGVLTLSAYTTSTGVSFNWSGPNSLVSTAQSFSINNVPFSASGDYFIDATLNGCTIKDTVSVMVQPIPPKPIAAGNTLLCEGDTLYLHCDSIAAAVKYSWSGPDKFYAIPHFTFINGVKLINAGAYKLTADLEGCLQDDTIAVKIKPAPEKPLVSSNSPLQTGQDLYLNLLNPQSGVGYIWTGPKGFQSSSHNPGIYRPTVDCAGTYFIVANLDGCLSSSFALVQIEERADTGKIIVYPVPNYGDFFIKAILKRDQHIPVRIFDAEGREVFRWNFKTQNKQLFTKIELKDYLATGQYILRLIADGKERIFRIEVIRR